MKALMRTALAAAAFMLMSAAIVHAQTSVSIGVHIGPPPPPRVVHVVEVAPEPDYVWIDGYWYPVGHRYAWHDGYWTRPPYPGAVWITARYQRDMFFEGYWDGPRGRIGHDHRWDRERHRDYRGKGRGRGRGRR